MCSFHYKINNHLDVPVPGFSDVAVVVAAAVVAVVVVVLAAVAADLVAVVVVHGGVVAAVVVEAVVGAVLVVVVGTIVCVLVTLQGGLGCQLVLQWSLYLPIAVQYQLINVYKEDNLNLCLHTYTQYLG